jgi:hypothetical protein
MIKRFSACLAAVALVALAAAAPQSASAQAPPTYDLTGVAKPAITGKQILNGLDQFVTDYPMRQNMMPNNEAAAQFLAKEAKQNGFTVRVLTFQAGTPARPVHVIEALKKGTTKPDDWLAFVAHYDIVPGIGGATVQGAYDDGSGTNMLRYFGKAFSNVKTHHTIALIWFDGEEWGLLGSHAYEPTLVKKHQKITAVMGFDMNGIAYPAPYCLCIYYGPRVEDAQVARPLIDYVNFDFLHFPQSDGNPGTAERWPFGTKSGVCDCGQNIRNSDESSFAQDYLTLRWTGMRTANDYPGYHQPWDTIPFMEQIAGSRAILEKGMENTFMSAYYTAMALDQQ